MNVLIVEDEKRASDRLKKLLLKYNDQINVLKVIETVREAIDWLNSESIPDLIFLDIQLADGLSFEIFDHIDVKSPIIFTTSYDQYAIRAFKVNSVDYLLKPLSQDDLNTALNKYQSTFQKNTDKAQDFLAIKEAISQLNGNKYKERFVVKIGDHIKIIPVSDISFFMSKNKMNYLFNNSDRSFIVDNTLDQLVELLDPKRFFRINRQFIISIESVEDLVSWSNSRLRVKLRNSETLEAIVARERVNDFKRWLEGESMLN